MRKLVKKLQEFVGESRQINRSFAKRRPSALKAIERSMEEGGTVVLRLKDKSDYEIYPHSIFIIDGNLDVVGEEIADHRMLSFPLKDIVRCRLNTVRSYRPNFCKSEVENFVRAIRSIEGSEARLILKIINPAEVDLRPPYHFLGNPYMAVNMDGELTWSASVELNDKTFYWLKKIKDDVEIIYPREVKLQFEQYLKNK